MQPSSTKEKIQEQAIKLFKEYNYDQVTVMQICKAAGITKRTFYYHFSSKDEIVDELIGQQEIVIKSLGRFLSKIKGIAGATILGDGNVALILDVASFYSTKG